MSSKRTAIAVLACGAATVLVAGSGVAATASSPGQSDSHDQRTLTLYQRQLGLLFVPGPGQQQGGPYGPGAQVVAAFALRSGSINGPTVGHETSQCIFDASNPVVLLCHSMNVVPGGQISTEGLVPSGNPYGGTSAVTGGTGKYREATGQVKGTPLGDAEGRNSRVVFELGD